ncbi:MAG TPA: restriction endonuclease [Luteibacter sp.]|uniref:restriction endonuclease n=1 Tax=Luteibacter sp. TaxID=1886636 RepID=UPI002CAE3182|nr:restriction endonuclease [Luteibacter sp.]HVI55842.1 restriction endonuclease [Luteibacter sp.]
MGYKKVKFRHDDALANMPWDEFERLMARHYAVRGYRVDHSGTGAKASRFKFDGGIDLKLFRDDEYIVVQCKRENVFQVTHNVVHQLIGVMQTQRATRAIVVNTGEFSAAAMEAAAKFPQIQLIDGLELRRMLAETGDLPTTYAADEALSSMAGRKPSNPSWSRRKRTPVPSIVAAVLAIGVILAGYYVVIPSVFTNMASSVVHTPRQTSIPRPVPAPTVMRATPPVALPSSNLPGSAIAGPASAPPPAITRLSKKEAEEWDRKNAESMRILEKTTPTLP